jgi:hypothetical protein
MSTRLQICDVKNNLLTVQLSQKVFEQAGNWMPDYPGKVRSGPDWDNNPWEGVSSDVNESFSNAICYTCDSTGVFVLVMRFNGLIQRMSYNFLKSGSGYLYASGNLTMAEGVFTWTNRDFVLSDSADDSDSDSAGPDDDSGGDSAYA